MRLAIITAALSAGKVRPARPPLSSSCKGYNQSKPKKEGACTPYVSCQQLLQFPRSSPSSTSHLFLSASASLSASQTPPLHGVLLETRTIDSTHSYPRDPSCFFPFPHHSFSLGPRSSPHLISYLSRRVYATALLFSSARSFGLHHSQSPSDWTHRLGFH